MGENIANEVTDKGLIFKIYKQLTQLNVKENKLPNSKMAKDLNRYFFKKDTQMVKRHMKRCSTVLIIKKKMQI